jgi:hypothetical protein
VSSNPYLEAGITQQQFNQVNTPEFYSADPLAQRYVLQNISPTYAQQPALQQQQYIQNLNTGPNTLQGIGNLARDFSQGITQGIKGIPAAGSQAASGIGTELRNQFNGKIEFEPNIGPFTGGLLDSARNLFGGVYNLPGSIQNSFTGQNRNNMTRFNYTPEIENKISNYSKRFPVSNFAGQSVPYFALPAKVGYGPGWLRGLSGPALGAATLFAGTPGSIQQRASQVPLGLAIPLASHALGMGIRNFRGQKSTPVGLSQLSKSDLPAEPAQIHAEVRAKLIPKGEELVLTPPEEAQATQETFQDAQATAKSIYDGLNSDDPVLLANATKTLEQIKKDVKVDKRGNDLQKEMDDLSAKLEIYNTQVEAYPDVYLPKILETDTAIKQAGIEKVKLERKSDEARMILAHLKLVAKNEKVNARVAKQEARQAALEEKRILNGRTLEYGLTDNPEPLNLSKKQRGRIQSARGILQKAKKAYTAGLTMLTEGEFQGGRSGKGGESVGAKYRYKEDTVIGRPYLNGNMDIEIPVINREGQLRTRLLHEESSGSRIVTASVSKNKAPHVYRDGKVYNVETGLEVPQIKQEGIFSDQIRAQEASIQETFDNYKAEKVGENAENAYVLDSLKEQVPEYKEFLRKTLGREVTFEDFKNLRDAIEDMNKKQRTELDKEFPC